VRNLRLSLYWRLPQSVRQRLDVVLEKRALGRLAPAACDTSCLARELPDFAGVPESEWRSATEEVARFGLADLCGAVNFGDRRALYQLARAMRTRSVLEVGTHLGASTTMLALALKRNGGGRFVSVDLRDVNGEGGAWREFGFPFTPRQMTDAIGVPVEYVASASVDYLERCREKFDLIFLDGGHEAVTVYREVPLALALLNPGGTILLHDFYPGAKPLWSDAFMMPGPWLATRRLIAEGAALRAQPLGRLPWPTKLGSSFTSLACVVRAS
jgi:predicted O-methyltransferase YrrM